ncbi:peptidoglycan D,D-transpeptidase FtsI family protein [Longispora albida]|uniref:peptidoglycan D,D-transpeptidase FtsI family protein n=1 Tax=Longispora albida TaxID=203523 RepID=UPI00036DCC6C|nr:penicillin-binding protein 2 [Longispora albida]
MNAPLRRVGIVALVLFGLLFVNLNYVQFYKGTITEEYRNSPYNGRVRLDEYKNERGEILLGGGVIVAKSVDTGGELRYQREYPFGPAFAHIVGYKSIHYGNAGIEYAENDLLSGKSGDLFVNRLTGMLTGKNAAGGSVQLTINQKAQEAAFSGLGNRKGAVVAIDATTGAILATASTPSFDPGPLSSNSGATAQEAWTKYNNDPAQPMLNRAFANRYPPGSTFKIIDSAVALSKGLTPDSMVKAGSEYRPPQTTHVIRNAHPSICPQAEVTLKTALTFSCNTAFSRMAVEDLKAGPLSNQAKAFGFGTKFETPMVSVASETGPLDDKDPAVLAGSAIGQQNVTMSPLQGALIGAAVANGGTLMKPYLVAETQGPDLSVIDKANPGVFSRPVTPDVASGLQEMMVSVVENGTGTAAKIPGVKVGGKTGTAETGAAADEHGWFVGFAIKGNQKIAVAVFLERAGEGGSREATKLAGTVMNAALAK